MKNKWVLLSLVLIIYLNNKLYSQYRRCDNESTDRTMPYPDLFDITNYDPKDTLYSVEHEKAENEKSRMKQLHKISDKIIDSLINIALNITGSQQNNALQALENIDSKRQIPAIEKLIQTNPKVIGICVDILISLNSIESEPLLIKILENSKSISMKLQIALFLAEIGEKTYSFKFLKSLWYADTDYRYPRVDCNTGFRDINTPESVNMLRIVTKDKNPYIALDAAACLAELNYKDEAFPIIKSFLYNQNPDIKISAAKVLAYNIGGKAAYELIKPLQNDSDPWVKRDSKQIIQRYLKKYMNNNG